ncbi:MAG: hypothetical protein ABI627_05880 [Polyangiaceae bacterium]
MAQRLVERAAEQCDGGRISDNTRLNVRARKRAARRLLRQSAAPTCGPLAAPTQVDPLLAREAALPNDYSFETDDAECAKLQYDVQNGLVAN